VYRKLTAVIVTLGLTLSIAFVAISQEKPAPIHPKVRETVAEAKAAATKVSEQAVKAAIDGQEKAVLLDVREPEEFAGGRLPGAVNIPRGTLEFADYGRSLIRMRRSTSTAV
jgi:3-mercaptopyruvate sulfurtransferase SseA